ncbi:MAG TPA: hypothetical protein VKH35_05070 [Thermoanaerobaculia bacterium]|nr:hypothetical protein [Thermoanaerobaculia bacterium]
MSETITAEPAEIPQPPAPKTLLETWGKNERMRHVPSVEWIVWKLDVDLRRRIHLLLSSFNAASGGDGRRNAPEAEFRALCRCIERIAETARHGRAATQGPSDLGARIDATLGNALAALNSIDGILFGRRYPFQTFERSKAEPLYGALLAVIDRVHRLTELLRAIDPRIDERLLEGLVVLQEPMPEKALA